MSLLSRSSFIALLLFAAAFPVTAKEKTQKPVAPAKTPDAPDFRPVVHQFCSMDDEVSHLSAVTDRSGKKLLNIHTSLSTDGVMTKTITNLTWEPAPEGMDYREEALGEWHGMRILASYYHYSQPADPGDKSSVEEVTDVVVSFAGADGVMHPFLEGERSSQVKELNLGFTPPSHEGDFPTIFMDWEFSGNGLYNGSLCFDLHPDGPHLKTSESGGRRVAYRTNTFDLSGHLRSTRLEWGHE